MISISYKILGNIVPQGKAHHSREPWRAVSVRGLEMLASALVLSAVVISVVPTRTVHAQQTIDRALELFNRGSYTPALQLFQQLARRDVVEAHYQLGRIYAQGDSVDKDIENAAVFLRRAADGGHHQAQFLLAQIYQDGLLKDVDEERAHKEAFALFKLAADGGVVDAALEVGIYLFDGKQDIPQDQELALAYLRQAADGGSDKAQFRLGTYHALNEDYRSAIGFYTLASENGNSDAFYNLGVLSFYGRGVPASDYDAARYFQVAAELGHGQAQNHLAWMYRYGRGVGQSYSQAAKYYYAAASKGWPDAQNQIAIALIQGRGVRRNHDLAARFMDESARQGHLRAVYNLALLYIHGVGKETDNQKAYDLLNIAASQGSYRALERLNLLKQSLDNEGITIFTTEELRSLDDESQQPSLITEPILPNTVLDLTIDLPVEGSR